MWYSRNKESEYENLDSEGEAEAAALAKQNVRSESEQREIDEFEEEERKILSQDSQKEVRYYKDTYVCWCSELLGRFVADFMKKDMTKIRDIRSIKEKKDTQPGFEPLTFKIGAGNSKSSKLLY